MRMLSDVPQTFAVSNQNLEHEYIGDGAYAAINNGGELVFTTENGISVGNRVVIHPTYWPIVESFIKRVRAKEIGEWRK